MSDPRQPGDAELIAAWLKKHGPTICPAIVVTPSIHALPLPPSTLPHNGQADWFLFQNKNPLNGWSKEHQKRAARSAQISCSHLKSNRPGAKI
jgi:hypothetical protein